MLLAWNEIKKCVKLSLNVCNIHDQCLFLNPSILNGGKTLYWPHFINNGITHIRDIMYEYVPGFLPQSVIIELIRGVDFDLDVNSDFYCKTIQ